MLISAPSYGLAFLAGLASFLSPCVFALVPAYVSYLGGRSAVAEDGQRSPTWIALSHGLAFVLGFSLVFIALGLLSSLLGAVLSNVQDILAKIGGVVAIVLGLHLAGFIHIPFLEYELRPQTRVQQEASFLSSGLMGIFFSAGWTPCVGPVLGVILTLAANGGSPVQGMLLLSAYSAGLAIPFLLAATQIGWVSYVLRRYPKLGITVQRIMGVVLAIVGVLLLSGRLATLGNVGPFFDVFDEGRVGFLLLIATALSLGLGALFGWWGRNRGKSFVDYWFIGTGISLALLIVLYLSGAFSFLAV